MTRIATGYRPYTGARRFREQLAAEKRLLGAAITLNDPLASEAMTDSVDFLWYDLEHVQLDPAMLNAHLMAARGRGVPALVRIADIAPSTIKPVLDAGADGLIVSQVRTVEEVETFVCNCLYPPMGRRGAGPRIPTNFGRANSPQYYELANESVYLSAMIETAEALQVIDEIVRVPRLDAVTIGPLDLSAELGHLGQLDHPDVVDAMQRVIDATRAAGLSVSAGMGAVPKFAEQMFTRGVNWIQMGSDFEFMIKHFESCRAEALQEVAVDDR